MLACGLPLEAHSYPTETPLGTLSPVFCCMCFAVDRPFDGILPTRPHIVSRLRSSRSHAQMIAKMVASDRCRPA